MEWMSPEKTLPTQMNLLLLLQESSETRQGIPLRNVILFSHLIIAHNVLEKARNFCMLMDLKSIIEEYILDVNMSVKPVTMSLNQLLILRIIKRQDKLQGSETFGGIDYRLCHALIPKKKYHFSGRAPKDRVIIYVSLFFYVLILVLRVRTPLKSLAKSLAEQPLLDMPELLCEGVDIQIGLAIDSTKATLAVKRRLACEMVKYWQQAQDNIMNLPLGNGWGERHMFFVKWKYVEARISTFLQFGGYTFVRNSKDLFRSFGFGTQPPVLIGLIIFQGLHSDYTGPTSGCTTCFAVIGANGVIVANAGDSRCVLCLNGQAVEWSKDHKPELEKDKKRILNAGGFFQYGRVNGNLNLTRAIGELELKQHNSLPAEKKMVTADPDITTYQVELQDDDKFLVLSCDGTWLCYARIPKKKYHFSGRAPKDRICKKNIEIELQLGKSLAELGKSPAEQLLLDICLSCCASWRHVHTLSSIVCVSQMPAWQMVDPFTPQGLSSYMILFSPLGDRPHH